MASTPKPTATAQPGGSSTDGLRVRVGLLDLHDWLTVHGLVIVGRRDLPGGQFIVLLAPCRPQDLETTL